MSDACLTAYPCETKDTASLITKQANIPKTVHSWDLKIDLDGISLFDISREFSIIANVTTTSDAAFAFKTGYDTWFCELEHEAEPITGAFSENIHGFATQIMYADIENEVYLLRKQEETITSTYTTQNPFKYLSPFGGMEALAFFPKLGKVKTVTYLLYIRGMQVFSSVPIVKNTAHVTTPIVWPMPGSTSTFRLKDPEYDWLNQTFFYWYNDPADMGYAPCNSGSISGLGEGTITGYEMALADGGKDFFYPQWIRDNAFVESELFHALFRTEAMHRFYDFIGGSINASCAKPYTTTFNVNLWISEAIIGNYIKYADFDFYSFFLPEVKQVINNLGNKEITDAFLAATKESTTCYPISLL